MGPLERREPHDGGFTIIEILMVLAIVGILLTMAMMLTRGIAAGQKRSITAARIAAVDAALVQFVQRHRRLPCPADGTIASGMPNAGTEAPVAGSPCTGNQVNGVVPWVTLGLPEVEATDGWDRRLTYRVADGAAPVSLAITGAMDMSQCDPAANAVGAGGNVDPDPATGFCKANCPATAANCTRPDNFLANKGLQIRNITGAVQMNPAAGTGAAYLVVSHGESGGGAYLNTGVLATSTTVDGAQEQLNYANQPLQPFYIDDSLSDVPGAGTHFDDAVSRPSILAVITRAALGPRAH